MSGPLTEDSQRAVLGPREGDRSTLRVHMDTDRILLIGVTARREIAERTAAFHFGPVGGR